MGAVEAAHSFTLGGPLVSECLHQDHATDFERVSF